MELNLPPRLLPHSDRSTEDPFLSRRVFAPLLVTALTAVAAVVVTASPAAAEVPDHVRPVSVSYTDSRRPDTSFPAGRDFPVGKWQSDTGMHISQAYLTFDLTPYRGKEIIEATAATGETAVTDCGRPREVEIWRTATPTSAPTWNDAPAAETKVADLGAGYGICPAPQLRFDLADALQAAVDDGREQVTFLLRIKGDHQDNPHHGRRMKPIAILITANAAPHVRHATPGRQPRLRGGLLLTNRNPRSPLTSPTRTAGTGDPATGGRHVRVLAVRAARRAHGMAELRPLRADDRELTYPAVRTARRPVRLRGPGADGHAASDWSPACEFTVDATPPATPTVTSDDYPGQLERRAGHPRHLHLHGGLRRPGGFPLRGVRSDGFRRRRGGQPFGQRDHHADLGGQFVLYVSERGQGRQPLRSTSYTFFVRATAPLVTDANPAGPLGEPRELTFSPRMENVVEYTYRLNDGEPVTVPAGADGTATVTVVPHRPGENTVTVTSRTADGLTSGTGNYRIHLVTWPTDHLGGVSVRRILRRSRGHPRHLCLPSRACLTWSSTSTRSITAPRDDRGGGGWHGAPGLHPDRVRALPADRLQPQRRRHHLRRGLRGLPGQLTARTDRLPGRPLTPVEVPTECRHLDRSGPRAAGDPSTLADGSRRQISPSK